MLLDESQERIKHSTSELYPDVPVHHWSELQGNKFKTKIDVYMAFIDGYKRRVRANIIGRPKGTYHAFWMDVIFDKEYVKQKLGREVVRPLESMPKDKFLEFMGEIYDSVKGK